MKAKVNVLAKPHPYTLGNMVTELQSTSYMVDKRRSQRGSDKMRCIGGLVILLAGTCMYKMLAQSQ